MNKYYSDEKNIQILIALLKAHRIKYVVASPGNTNLTLVASLQQDSYFIIYSSVDERSAAYMACGLAAETGEAVRHLETGKNIYENEKVVCSGKGKCLSYRFCIIFNFGME